MRNIVRYLTKCTRIPGVNGVGNWKFVEHAIGRKDGKAKQLSKLEKGYSTPWMERKSNMFLSYENRIFLKVNAALEDTYKEIHAKHTEYKQLLDFEQEDIKLQGEEGLRRASMIANKKNTSEKRREEIRVRMAEVKGLVETVDKALEHNLERAENILCSHISEYWRGIVKTSEKELPSYPGNEIKLVRGKTVYENHLKEIRIALNQVLD